jgi:hypothetical protein
MWRAIFDWRLGRGEAGDGADPDVTAATVKSRGRHEGCSSLVQSMEKAPKAPSVIRSVIVLAVVIMCVATVGVVGALRHSRASSTTVRAPNPVVVPSTLPYSARPGPNDTRILTEPVDPLTLAVPNSWKSPAADPLVLNDELARFAQDAPALAGLLQAVVTLEGKSAIRLFAYQPVALQAFVLVTSYSTPTQKDLTAAVVDTLAGAAKVRTKGAAVSGVQLPVGAALKLNFSLVSQNRPVVVEVLILIAGGRSLVVEMVSETTTVGVPALFDQIAQSLRLG